MLTYEPLFAVLPSSGLCEITVPSCAEGTVSVEITGSGTAEVQAYIDGSKVSDRTINFN